MPALLLMTGAAGRGRLAKRLLLLLGGLVAGLLLVEGAVRVRQYVKYGTFGVSVAERVVDERTGLEIPEPGSVTGGIRIDSRGFRNPEIELPKPAGRIRLAFLGGSTTFCAEASANEATWPAVACRLLAERFPGSSFDYVNAAVVGYTTIESRINLELRVKPLDPDVVVICHATNDLARDTRELAKEQGIWSGDEGEPSWLARISLAAYLVEKNLEVAARKREAEAGEQRLEFDPEALAAGFAERLAGLVRDAQADAAVVAVATFPTRIRREQSPEERLAAANTSLYYMPYMTPEGLLDAFDACNFAIREVARETGAVLIAGEDEIPADGDHFNDSVHLRDPGCRIRGAQAAAALSASPAFLRLLER